MADGQDLIRRGYDATRATINTSVQLYLTGQGMPPETAVLVAGTLVEVLPAVVSYIIEERRKGRVPRGREVLEADRILTWVTQLGQMVTDGRLPAWKLETALAAAPALQDLFDRIIRNVEQETVIEKLRYQANLARSAILASDFDTRHEEFQHHTNAILTMSTLDFEILRILPTGAVWGDVDHEGEAAGISGQPVKLQELIANLDITSPMVRLTGAPRRQTERPLPDGYLSACLIQLINLGFIDEIIPNLIGATPSRSHQNTEYKLLALGYRFLEWCDREGSILSPKQDVLP